MPHRTTRRGRRGRPISAALCGAFAAFLTGVGASAQPDESRAARRGAYLFAAGGCESCHTDFKNKGPALAGGGPIKTPFGTFYAPNITPDSRHGIGQWRAEDFARAMRDGVAPDGSHYFPVFPYTSYTNLTDADIAALWAYLRTVPPVARASTPHRIDFPFHWRFLQTFWKWLFFTPGPFAPDPARSAQWNRGAYLARALVHCGECHTPRNLLGGPKRDMEMAGAADGPEGEAVPNITPDSETGIGEWDADDVTTFLQTGVDPDGDVAGSLMADVIEHSTGKLSEADLAALAAYLSALPPIRNRIGAAPAN